MPEHPTPAHTVRDALIDEYDKDAVAAFESYMGTTITEHGPLNPDHFIDAYEGHFESGAAYAEHLADQISNLPEGKWPTSHIDWEAAWNELTMGDYYMVNDTRQFGTNSYEVASGHVFRSV